MNIWSMDRFYNKKFFFLTLLSISSSQDKGKENEKLHGVFDISERHNDAL